jgi:hypothetical protein
MYIVMCVKITIKKVGYSWVSIVLIGTSSTPKHNELWSKFILTPISQLASFGEHIEQMVPQHESSCVLVVYFFSQTILLLVMACHFPSSSNPRVDLDLLMQNGSLILMTRNLNQKQLNFEFFRIWITKFWFFWNLNNYFLISLGFGWLSL